MESSNQLGNRRAARRHQHRRRRHAGRHLRASLHRRGQPRSRAVPRSRPARPPPPSQPASRLRLRHPHLRRQFARPHGGAGRRSASSSRRFRSIERAGDFVRGGRARFRGFLRYPVAVRGDRPLSNAFDFAPLLRPGLPPAAAKFTGVPKYNFTGGHNDPDELPLDDLIAAANSVLQARGPHARPPTASPSGPQGYRAAARIPGAEAQARRRHRLHRRQHPAHLGLAAGASIWSTACFSSPATPSSSSRTTIRARSTA